MSIELTSEEEVAIFGCYSELAVKAAVESIIAARLEQQREALAAAIDACELKPSDAIRKAESIAPSTAAYKVAGGYHLARKRAARIVREYQPGEGT